MVAALEKAEEAAEEAAASTEAVAALEKDVLTAQEK
jgi:hypothetical protein